jgi:hypothetical protein
MITSPTNRMIPVAAFDKRIDAPTAIERIHAMIAKTADVPTHRAIIEDADARTSAALKALNSRGKVEHGHQALAGVLAYATLAKAIPPALNNMLDGIEA